MSLPCRLARYQFLLLVLVGAATAGAALAQSERLLPVRGGGDGVGLASEHEHTIVAHHNDGEVGLLCLQGDRHRAFDAMRLMLLQGARDELELDDRRASRAETVRVAAAMRPHARAGADDANRLLLYMPSTLQPGSSRSHFDTRAQPNLLMEPGISADLSLAGIDITADTLRDLGWRRAGGIDAEYRFTDTADAGFNDPELGTARRAALAAAVEVWGRHLGTRPPLVIEASFADLTCSAGAGAVLAGAAPTFAFRDFAGALPDTWYAGPMAESISRSDLSGPDEADLFIVFNAAIDRGCLAEGTSWHYGTEEPAPPGTLPFLTVALHEIAHGLGFTGFADLTTGRFLHDTPDIFSRLTFDNELGRGWDAMSRGERRKSAVRDGEVVTVGRRTRRAGRELLEASAVLRIDSPAELAGIHRVGVAAFGPSLEEVPLAGELVLVDDGTAAARRGCNPLVNPAAVAGKVALVIRGDCVFTDKVRHAQMAGAVGVVVLNNLPGPPANMGGIDGAIAIPSVMLDRETGAAIRRVLR